MSWQYRLFLFPFICICLLLATYSISFAQPILITDKDGYAPAESITVMYAGFPGYNTDWITIVPANVADNMSLEYHYTNGATKGRMTFSGLKPGAYEARAYFNWNGTRSHEVQARYRFVVGAQQKSPSARTETNNSGAAATQLDYAFHTFILWVPGTSYLIDNFDSQTSTLYISAGTIPKSTITINPDGTYAWNSAWDGRMINGRWTSGKDGTLQLLNGQEGKTWTVEKSKIGKNEDIFLMDGFTWYSGKIVTVKNRG